MAIALEGVDLLLIALFLFLLAFLHATKWTIEPLVHALNSALGWVPGVGGLVKRSNNAVIGALNSAIGGTERAITVLWHGFVWSFRELELGLRALAHNAESALHYLRHTALPAFVHAALAPLRLELAAARALANSALTYAHREVARLEALITARVAAAVATVRADLKAVEHALRHDLLARIDAVEAVVESDLRTGLHDARVDAASAVSTLRAAEAAAIGHAERTAELGLDEIHKLLGGLSLTDAAGLIAAVPLLQVALSALEAETGLGRAECRSKVKGICGVPLGRWMRLVGLLALSSEWPGLVEFAEGMAEHAGEVVGAIEELAGV